MKHLRKGRKLGRIKKQREALLKMLLGNFILKGRIVTTEAKAKELKMFAERLINQTKSILLNQRDELSAIRLAKSKAPRSVKVERLKAIAEKFASRKGGYTRIIRKGIRKSDSARIVVLELVEDELVGGK